MQPYVTVCVAFLHENRFGISLDLKLPRNLDIGFSTVAPCFLWSPSLKHEICKWHLQIESTWRVYIKLAMSLWNVRNCRWPQQLLHYWQSALLREVCLPSIKEAAFGDIDIDCNSSISATFRSVSSASPLVLQRSWQKATGEGLPCWVWERVEVGFVGWHIDLPFIFWICLCIILSSNSSIKSYGSTLG